MAREYKDVVVGLANGHVQRWSVSDRRATQAFGHPSDRVVGLASSDDGTLLAAGCDDFATKPILAAKLIECCTLWAEKNRARTPAPNS